MSRTTPRRAQSSEPLEPTQDWPDEPEQLELLAGASAQRTGDDTTAGRDAHGSTDEPPDDDPGATGGEWRVPPAVTYLDASALAEVDTADPADADPDLPYWLAFNRVKGIGPARFALLLGAF